MGCSPFLHVVMMALCAGVMGVHAVAAEVVAVPPVSRVEVVSHPLPSLKKWRRQF